MKVCFIEPRLFLYSVFSSLQSPLRAAVPFILFFLPWQRSSLKEKVRRVPPFHLTFLAEEEELWYPKLFLLFFLWHLKGK